MRFRKCFARPDTRLISVIVRSDERLADWIVDHSRPVKREAKSLCDSGRQPTRSEYLRIPSSSPRINDVHRCA